MLYHIHLRFLAALVMAAALTAAAPLRAAVLATVNGDSITTTMMEEELRRIHTMQPETMHRGDFDPSRLLQRMINDRLFVQEAEAIGLAGDPEITEPVMRYREGLAYRALVREAVPDTFTASDAEVRAEFARLFERFDLRYLCVNDSALALQLADSIRQGVAMDRLAREHSIDRYKKFGGLATNHMPFDLPESLQPDLIHGKLGDLIGPRYVWRVWASIRIEARRPADEAMYDSAKAVIRLMVINQKRIEGRRQYLEQARQGIPVNVDTVQVDSIIVRMGMGQAETERPVATVAGKRVLTANTLRGKYIHKMAESRDAAPRNVLYSVLREQVETMILKEVAERQDLISRPEFDAPTRAYRDSLLVVDYLQEVVAPTVKISDEDIATYYEKNQNAFRGPDQYKIATITRDSLSAANADYAALKSGTDFAWLARRNSSDDFKDKGGERNWLDASEFSAAVRAELDSVPLGGIVGPVPLDEVYVVMKLLDRKKGEPLVLKDVSDRIRAVLVQPMQMQAIDAAVAALRKTADIHVYEEVLKSLQISGQVGTTVTETPK